MFSQICCCIITDILKFDGTVAGAAVAVMETVIVTEPTVVRAMTLSPSLLNGQLVVYCFPRICCCIITDILKSSGTVAVAAVLETLSVTAPIVVGAVTHSPSLL